MWTVAAVDTVTGMSIPTPEAPAAPAKPQHPKGVKIAAGIFIAVIAVACGIGAIHVFSGSSHTDTKTRAVLAASMCEDSIKKKVASPAIFSKEEYFKSKDPTWEITGNVTANGTPGIFTCTLKRDGDSFTLIESDAVTE